MSTNHSQIVKIVKILIGLFILFATAHCLYITLKPMPKMAQRLSKAYFSEYQESNKLSLLLESAIVFPSRDNLLYINNILMAEGEYKLAVIINNIVKDPKFPGKVAEASLFNLEFKQAEKYLSMMDENKTKEELQSFNKRLHGQDSEMINNPSTDAGKLLTMVDKKDFSLYLIENEIGKSIRAINQTKPQSILNVLTQAENLYENGYYYLALETLEKDPGNCTRDYFLLKGDMYSHKGLEREALATTEQGLICNPTDQSLLSRAIEYSNQLGETNKAGFFSQRLNYLVSLTK